MGRGVGQTNMIAGVTLANVMMYCFLQAFNEPDVYETGDLPEDDQAQFESVRRRFLYAEYITFQSLTVLVQLTS